MKTHEPKSNTLKHVGKLPFAEEMLKTAELMAANATESLDEGKIGSIEAAGHISMAALLAGVSNGSIPPLKAYGFLKTIAQTKTPAPVQKIEAHQEVDLRAILVEAVGKNPTALQDVVAISVAAREQVRIKLGSDDNQLELQPLPSADVPVDSGDDESGDDSAMGSSSLEEYSVDLRELGIMKNSVSQASVNKDWAPGEVPPEITRLKERGK